MTTEEEQQHELRCFIAYEYYIGDDDTVFDEFDMSFIWDDMTHYTADFVSTYVHLRRHWGEMP